MQPPAQQPSPPATAMYMPPQQAMMGGGLFSLHKFLMIGVILILIAGLVSVLPDFSGPPAVVDYENLTGSDLQTKMNEEEEKYNDFVRLMDTFATIIGMAGVGLIGYAFVREAYDEDTTTPALRITLLILGTIMLLQLVGSGFNLSVSL
tara:strand:- start:3993 stop:4439 length:447 start_codon:yes stop_codon:yes gene_type:complete